MSAARLDASRARLLAGALLLGLGVWLGWNLWLWAPRRELEAMARRLPDLPQVRQATLRRDPKFATKVWLHRVDSIERALLVARKYRGMEIDVVYDSAGNYFDVGHPPVPSAGISLDSLLAALPDPNAHYFWLDFKNLSESNAEAACRLLESIARRHGVLGNLVVESTEPRPLSRFTAAGFYTSYYLFPDTGLAGMSPGQVERYYQEVKANLAVSRVNALSSSYHSLPFMEAYFPEADLLLWYLDSADSPPARAAVDWLGRKSRVKVILIKHYSRGYR